MVVPKDFRPFFLGGNLGNWLQIDPLSEGDIFHLVVAPLKAPGPSAPLNLPALSGFQSVRFSQKRKKNSALFFALNCTDL